MFIKKLLNLWFGLSFDDPEKKDDGIFLDEDGMPDVKVDYDAIFGDKDEKKDDEKKEVTDPDEEESEESEESDQDESEEDDDDAEEKDDENDDEAEEEDEDEEGSEDEDDDEEDTEEESEDDVSTKRLKDTQRALHRTEDKYRKLKKDNAKVLERLEKLEKATEKPKEDEGKDKELTLKTVDPKALAEFMKKDPVNAMRWITDQQVKLSIGQQQEARKQADADAAKQKEREQSEEQAFKSYPVLEEVLELDDEDLEDLKSADPDKHKFASEVVKYYKRNLERGDDDALLNAANRVYREMNPKQLAKVLKEAKKQASKEFRHKKKVLGKMSVAKGGKKGKKASSGFKSLSDTEFAALTPQQQDEYMLKSIDHRLQKNK